MTSEGTQLVTTRQDGSDPRLLSQEGFVTGVSYSFATPGGCNQLQATLAAPAGWRSDSLNTGRLCRAMRGGTVVWSGVLDDPQQGSDGWAVTAHGAGGFGDDYLAIYTGSWGTGVFNNAVDAAVARGLGWVRVTDIGAVANIWTGQATDSGAQTITDLINSGCSKGGLTWAVQTVPQGNLLTVFPLPTTANRILVAGDPVGRATGDGPTTVYVQYQTTWDTTKVPAKYALTSVTQAATEAALGRREDLMDISSAGVYSAGAAQAPATQALKRYQRVAFADSFTVQPGELLTSGGQPVDLGTFWADGIAAMVCELWLADYPYGGEMAGGPIALLVGAYEYNADGTATITAFDSARHDWSSVMSAAVDNTPVRVQPVAKAKKKAKK